jgi:lysophospholipase L1-like esterase
VRRALALCVVLAIVGLGCSDDAAPERPAPRPSVTSTTTTSTPATTAPPGATTTVPGPLTVAGLGDSLLFEAEPELRALVPALDVQTHAVPGLTAVEGRIGLGPLLERRPNALVVVLGTNDIRDGNVSPEELAAIEDLADRIDEVPCVRWAEVSTSGTSASVNEAGVRWNRELAAAASAHGFGLVPWAAAVAVHPEWLVPDGIHHTPEGQAQFARMLLESLNECLGAATS